MKFNFNKGTWLTIGSLFWTGCGALLGLAQGAYNKEQNQKYLSELYEKDKANRGLNERND